MAVSERSVEEILEIFREYGIGLDDICRVIVHLYDFETFDGTPIGKLRDAAKEVLNSQLEDPDGEDFGEIDEYFVDPQELREFLGDYPDEDEDEEEEDWII